MLLFVLAANAYAGNPFLKKQKEEKPQQQEKIQQERSASWIPGFIKPVLNKSIRWQKEVRKRITHFTGQMKDEPFGSAFFMFLLLSFVYGILHAIGPGHGKSIVVSYFLNRPGRLSHGILMGNLITFTHVLSGVAVVLFLYLVASTTRLVDFEEASPMLEAISYSLMIAIGIYLLIHTTLELRKQKEIEEESIDPDNKKGMIITALATGLVPCPGAAIILLFSIIQGVLLQGLFAMLFIALGMGLTTTSFALAAIGARKSVLNLASGNRKIFYASYGLLSFAGALAIIFIGSAMLTGVL